MINPYTPYLGIPDGLDAFTMASLPKRQTPQEARRERDRAHGAVKRERARASGENTKAKQAALALRTDAERAADRVADREAALLARKPPGGFNVPIPKSAVLGASKSARARAGI